jgi:hypothetical protein
MSDQYDDRDYTISEFCEVSRISKSQFFNLKRQGLGPREMLVCGSVLISHEARLDWKRDMEAQAASSEGKKIAAARKAKMTRAGQLAAKSPIHVSTPEGQRRRREQKAQNSKGQS